MSNNITSRHAKMDNFLREKNKQKHMHTADIMINETDSMGLTDTWKLTWIKKKLQSIRVIDN